MGERGLGNVGFSTLAGAPRSPRDLLDEVRAQVMTLRSGCERGAPAPRARTQNVSAVEAYAASRSR